MMLLCRTIYRSCIHEAVGLLTGDCNLACLRINPSG